MAFLEMLLLDIERWVFRFVHVSVSSSWFSGQSSYVLRRVVGFLATGKSNTILNINE